MKGYNTEIRKDILKGAEIKKQVLSIKAIIAEVKQVTA